jgi:signal transduction histidine kinase/ActR/RegA family two-component response regulator
MRGFAPDLVEAILQERSSTAGLPAFLSVHLGEWGIDGIALLRAEGRTCKVQESLVSRGQGWSPDTRFRCAWPDLVTRSGETAAVFDPGPGGGSEWGPALAAAGYGRAVILPLAPPRAGGLALLCARRSKRPFPAFSVHAAAALAALLSARREVLGTGAQRGSGDELALLLSASLDLSRAADIADLLRVLEESLDRVLAWDALILTPGGDGPSTPTLVRGGAALPPGSRQRFEERWRGAALGAGLPTPPLPWPAGTGAPDGGETARSPWIVAVPRSRGPAGILALHPSSTTRDGEDTRRMLAALAQQAGLALDRLAAVEGRQEGRLAAILEALPLGVVITGDAGEVKVQNPAARRMVASLSGAVLEEGRGAAGHLREFLPGRDVAAAEETEFCALADQRVYVARWVPMRRAEDTGSRVLVLADVTSARREQERALQGEKLLALGEILSGVAHELNNPLATVIGFSELLASRATDAALGERLELIAAEAARCRRIVSNLLDLVRNRPPERAPVSLQEVMDGVLRVLSHQLESEEIEITWSPAPHLPAVHGDRHQIQQILINLLTNARHALVASPLPRHIALSCVSQGDRVRLEVGDSGPGIPAAQLERIFDPFYTTKEGGQGTGLGLALARRMAIEHGGALSALSRPGAGATFVLELPASRGQVELPPAPAEGATAARGRRVLVVDDEAPFRLLLKEALEADGNRVEVAENGEDALHRLDQEEFDAVITDLGMPVRDGASLHREAARRRPALGERFIFMSGALVEAGGPARSRPPGLPLLSKPFSLDELRAALASVPLPSGAAAPAPVVRSRRDPE